MTKPHKPSHRSLQRLKMITDKMQAAKLTSPTPLENPAAVQAASPVAEPYNGKPYLPTGAVERKGIPLCTGCLDYFPLALCEVAKISKRGNDQHNPGQPLHWSRGKSMDQMDTTLRHIMERGGRDVDGERHLAKAAWRILAELQIECERDLGLPISRGSWEAGR